MEQYGIKAVGQPFSQKSVPRFYPLYRNRQFQQPKDKDRRHALRVCVRMHTALAVLLEHIQRGWSVVYSFRLWCLAIPDIR